MDQQVGAYSQAEYPEDLQDPMDLLFFLVAVVEFF